MAPGAITSRMKGRTSIRTQLPHDTTMSTTASLPIRSIFAPLALFGPGVLHFGADLTAAPLARALQDERPEPLGVGARFDAQYGGVVITDVDDGSLAARSGLKKGDIVASGVDAGGRDYAIQDLEAFGRLVVMQRFSLLVYRAGVAEEQAMKIEVTRGGGGVRDVRGRDARGGDLRSGDAPREQAPAGTLVLEKRQFEDPGLGMTSHTMLVPKGWQGNIQPLWTPTETAFMHIVGRVGGDGMEICFDRGRSFSYSEDPMFVQAMRAQGPAAMQSFIRPPSRVGEATLLALMPALRPQAQNVQVIKAERMPEIEKIMNNMLGNIAEQSRQNGMGIFMAVEDVRVRYREAGRSFDESFFYICQIMTIPNLMGGPPTVTWMLAGTRSVRAPSEVFDARAKDLCMISGTFQPTPRWGICSSELQQKLSAIRHKGNMDRLRIMSESSRSLAKTYSDISDSQMASWKRQQADKDAGHRAFTNSILEVHDYKSRDGDSIQLSNHYDRVFQDPLGNVILTNDVNYDPTGDTSLRTNDWQQLGRIGR